MATSYINAIDEDEKQSRDEQRKNIRLNILSGALDVFIRKSYDDVKIQDIAHAADVNAYSIVHCFESKDKIYEELFKIATSFMQSLFSEAEEEPLDFFSTTAVKLINCIEKYPFIIKLFFFMPQVHRNDAMPEAVKKLLSENENVYSVVSLRNMFVEKIKQGQLSGGIKEGDPFALVIAFFGAINGIAMLTALNHRNNNKKTPIVASEWIVDIIKK